MNADAQPGGPGPQRDDLSEAERELLRPVLDLIPDLPDQDPSTDEADESAESADPTESADTPDGTDGSEAAEDVALPDLSGHVDAYQEVLDSLTSALDDESLLGSPSAADISEPKPGPGLSGPGSRAGEERA